MHRRFTTGTTNPPYIGSADLSERHDLPTRTRRLTPGTTYRYQVTHYVWRHRRGPTWQRRPSPDFTDSKQCDQHVGDTDAGGPHGQLVLPADRAVERFLLDGPDRYQRQSHRPVRRHGIYLQGVLGQHLRNGAGERDVHDRICCNYIDCRQLSPATTATLTLAGHTRQLALPADRAVERFLLDRPRPAPAPVSPACPPARNIPTRRTRTAVARRKWPAGRSPRCRWRPAV